MVVKLLACLPATNTAGGQPDLRPTLNTAIATNISKLQPPWFLCLSTFHSSLFTLHSSTFHLSTPRTRHPLLIATILHSLPLAAIILPQRPKLITALSIPTPQTYSPFCVIQLTVASLCSFAHPVQKSGILETPTRHTSNLISILYITCSSIL